MFSGGGCILDSNVNFLVFKNLGGRFVDNSNVKMVGEQIIITVKSNEKENSFEVTEKDKEYYWGAVKKLLEETFNKGNRAGVGTVQPIGNKK